MSNQFNSIIERILKHDILYNDDLQMICINKCGSSITSDERTDQEICAKSDNGLHCYYGIEGMLCVGSLYLCKSQKHN